MVIHRRVSGLDELKIKKSGVYCIMPYYLHLTLKKA